MRLWHYIKNNIKQKRTRSILSIFGMTFSTMAIVVVSLIANRYVISTEGFFSPFAQFDQIVERGTNYFQLVPVESVFDESESAEIGSFFNTTVYPSLLIQNDNSLGSFEWNFLMGIPLNYVSLVWKEIGLSQGKWMENGAQIVVGYDYRQNSSVEYMNQSFQVSGVLNPMNTYLDRVIVFQLSTLQQLSGLINKITLIFVPRIENYTQITSKLIDFENLYPNLDYLNEEDMKSIKGDLMQFSDQLAQIFTMIASISALIFVFTIETLNIINHQSDITLFETLGASKNKIIQIYWLSTFIIIAFGLLIGIPFSLLIYILFFAYSEMILFGENDFFGALKQQTSRSLNTTLMNGLFQTIGLIFISGIIFSLIPILIALRKIRLNSVKERF